MPSEDNKIMEFNEHQKSDEMPYIFNADVESSIKRIDECKNNPEKLSTTKIGEHTPCRYLMCTIWAFDGIENKNNIYRAEDWMKIFCE